MIHDKLLNALKKRQSEFALQSLKAPGDKTAYDYGYRVGSVAGLENAMDVLVNLVAEEEKQGQEL